MIRRVRVAGAGHQQLGQVRRDQATPAIEPRTGPDPVDGVDGPPSGPPVVVLRNARHCLALAPGIDCSAIVGQSLVGAAQAGTVTGLAKGEVAAEAQRALREALHRLQAGDEEAEPRQLRARPCPRPSRRPFRRRSRLPRRRPRRCPSRRPRPHPRRWRRPGRRRTRGGAGVAIPVVGRVASRRKHLAASAALTARIRHGQRARPAAGDEAESARLTSAAARVARQSSVLPSSPATLMLP